MKFNIGGNEHEKIEVEISDHDMQNRSAYHWLSTSVSVRAGAFTGVAGMSILADELVSFQEALDPLYANLRGEAHFQTIEGQLELKLVGNGYGRIELTGHVMDNAGTGNRLNFHFDLDQTQLAESIAQLKRVIAKFPSR